jgi:hypothetical protein
MARLAAQAQDAEDTIKIGYQNELDSSLAGIVGRGCEKADFPGAIDVVAASVRAKRLCST